MALLAIIPWVLTVGALLFIIIRSKRQDQFEEEENDFIIDDEDQEIVRVAVYGDKAYWVYDNVFYESDTTREPDFTTARPIDTMSMSPKQLNKLLAILDELQEQGKE
jgi:hypothetical protein